MPVRIARHDRDRRLETGTPAILSRIQGARQGGILQDAHKEGHLLDRWTLLGRPKGHGIAQSLLCLQLALPAPHAEAGVAEPRSTILDVLRERQAFLVELRCMLEVTEALVFEDETLERRVLLPLLCEQVRWLSEVRAEAVAITVQCRAHPQARILFPLVQAHVVIQCAEEVLQDRVPNARVLCVVVVAAEAACRPVLGLRAHKLHDGWSQLCREVAVQAPVVLLLQPLREHVEPHALPPEERMVRYLPNLCLLQPTLMAHAGKFVRELANNAAGIQLKLLADRRRRRLFGWRRHERLAIGLWERLDVARAESHQWSVQLDGALHVSLGGTERRLRHLTTLVDIRRLHGDLREECPEFQLWPRATSRLGKEPPEINEGLRVMPPRRSHQPCLRRVCDLPEVH
mmetsp:Transcript_33347/g.92165  ORF Transcript_33347/g.92165 Transcript_33347/m.92165 type:complete len:402 (-) Transcript_33347:1344-2549(-)